MGEGQQENSATKVKRDRFMPPFDMNFVRVLVCATILNLVPFLALDRGVAGDTQHSIQAPLKRDQILPFSLTLKITESGRTRVLSVVYKSLDYWRIEATGVIAGTKYMSLNDGTKVWSYIVTKNGIERVKKWEVQHKDLKNKRLAKWNLLMLNLEGVAFLANPKADAYKDDFGFVKRAIAPMRFIAKSKIGDIECNLYRYPVSEDAHIDIWFGCADGLLKQQVIELRKSSTRYTTIKAETKVKVKADEFSFQPPSGAYVEDLTEEVIREEREQSKESGKR
jgi:hypothetical protein